MTNSDNRLLDLCLEIEGLIALGLQRQDMTPARTNDLLIEKATLLLQSLKERSAQPTASSAEVCEPQQTEASVCDEPPVEEIEEVIESQQHIEEEEIAQSAIEEEIGDSMISPEDDSEETPSDDSKEGSTDPTVEVMRNDILKAPELSLNDKFRFRRDLFNNSEVDMAEAIQQAESLNTQEELEDYFFNDLCWDAEDPTVKDFMAIIKKKD